VSSDAVEIRLLSAADITVLDRVDPDVFDNPVQRELAEQYLSTPGNLLAVVTLSGVVVGMASAIAYVHPDKPLQLFINEVGVSQRVQGRGIGKRLMRALLEQGRIIGCTEAWVATEINNKPARALYASLAGVEDQEVAVVYTWQLGSNRGGVKGGDA
jgi:ribosomal protein S18 acetylase RimI-like enzyme